MHQLVTGGFETTTAALGTAMWLCCGTPTRWRSCVPTGRCNATSSRRACGSTVRSPGCGAPRPAPSSSVGSRFPRARRSWPAIAAPTAMPTCSRSRRVRHRRERTRTSTRVRRRQSLLHRSRVGAAELMSAFTAILDRMDDIELAEPLDDQPHEFSFFLRPMKRLPLKFTKK